MRRIRRTLVIGALGIAALVAIPVALAATGTARHPTDPATAQVRQHVWIKACDPNRDGRRARAWWDSIASPGWYNYSAWAPSGGCSQEQGASLGVSIRHFRICVEHEGCGPWKW